MGNFVSTYVKFLQNFFTPKLLKSAEFWLNYSPENKGWRFLGDSVLAEVKPTGFPATSMSVCSGGKSFVDAHLLHGDVGSRTWLSAVAAARLISLVDALIALHLQPGVRPGTAYLPGTQEALCAADDVRASLSTDNLPGSTVLKVSSIRCTLRSANPDSSWQSDLRTTFVSVALCCVCTAQ